jgi:hypothetical protein
MRRKQERTFAGTSNNTARSLAVVAGAVLCITALAAPLAQAHAQQTASISGSVLEDVGPLDVIKLIADAKVYLQVPEEIIIVPLGEQQTELDLAPIRPYHTVDSTFTDNLGRFAFADKPTGSYRLRLVKDGYYTKLVNLELAKDTIMTVHLVPDDATFTLTGRVYEGCPEGTVCLWTPPLEGCTVSVTISYPLLLMRQAPGPGPEPMYTAITDADGRYTIRDIPISGYEYAAYIADASKQGYRPSLETFEPQVNGTSIVDFVLTPFATPVTTPAAAAPARNAVRVGPTGRSVIVDLVRPTSLTIETFSLDGRTQGEGVRKHTLTAGSHEIALGQVSGAARNTRLIRVSGEDFTRSMVLPRTSLPH